MMATGTIKRVLNVEESAKQVNGVLNSGVSITLKCTSFVGVFGYNGSNCALFICRSNFIVPIVHNGNCMNITQSNGEYTITNTSASYGLRYMLFYV